MAALVVAEHDNAGLKPATLNAVAAANEIAGADVDILVAGKDCRPAAEAAAKVGGIRKVLLADDAVYEHELAENVAPLVVKLAGNYSHLLAAATTSGKNLMPRVAALLDVMQISDVIKVLGPDTFERPIYAGNAIQTVRSHDQKKVITLRTTAFEATERVSIPSPGATSCMSSSTTRVSTLSTGLPAEPARRRSGRRRRAPHYTRVVVRVIAVAPCPPERVDQRQHEPDEADHEENGSSRLDVETTHVCGHGPLQDRADSDKQDACPNRHALGLPSYGHRYPRADG